jgi:hypothetical protein
MSENIRSFPLIGVLLTALVAGAGANEPPAAVLHDVGPLQAYGVRGCYYAYCTGAVPLEKKSCFVWLGMRKFPSEKEAYAYILLGENVPSVGGVVDFGTVFPGATGENGRFSTMFSRFEKKNIQSARNLTVEYKFTLNQTAKKLLDETLTIEKVVIQPGSRVILVDMAENKAVCTPVKADFPKEVPTLGTKLPKAGDDVGKAWAAIMQRVVEELRTQSPEIKKFLE